MASEIKKQNKNNQFSLFSYIYVQHEATFRNKGCGKEQRHSDIVASGLRLFTILN